MEALKVRPEENVRPEEQGLAESPVQHTAERCWRGFERGRWQRAIDVRDFIVRNRHALRRRRILPRRAVGAHPGGLGEAAALLPGRAAQGRARRRRRDALHPAGPRAGLDRPRQRGHRRPADRPAVPPRHLPGRRPAHGRSRAEGRGLRRRPGRARGLHTLPQDAQRRRLRRLHAGDHALPQVRHHHRPARRLWPRPHHRRLPPRRALRHRPADRGQARGAGADRRHVADRRHHPHAARSWPSRCAR